MRTGPDSRLRLPLIVATIALCALFLAQGATRIVAASLIDDGREASSYRRKKTPAETFEPRRYDPRPLLQRNIFDSAQGDLTASAESELELALEPASTWDASAALPRCEGKLRLVGAVASSDDWGMAAIVGSTGETSFVRRGSQVDDATVLGIGSDSVVVQPAGESVCQLEMFTYSTQSSPRLASARKPTPKKKSAKEQDIRGPKVKRDRNAGLTEEEMAQGIQRISDSSFVIKKKILDKVLDNPGKLMGIARIRPHQEGGKTVGMQVARLRPNTLLTKLGLKNGDILTGIDGNELSSPDTALQAYASLRTAESLSLTVRRKGSPMTIRYSLQ